MHRAPVWLPRLAREELREGLYVLAFISGDLSLPGDGGASSEPPKFPVETRSGRWWLLGKEATRIAVRAAWDVSRGDVYV